MSIFLISRSARDEAEILHNLRHERTVERVDGIVTIPNIGSKRNAE